MNLLAIYRQRSVVGLIVGIALSSFLISGCKEKPTPVVVYVTATESATPELEATVISGDLPPTPTLTQPTRASETVVASVEPLEIAVNHTPTATATTPTKTLTPTGTLNTATATVTTTPTPTHTKTSTPTPSLTPTKTNTPQPPSFPDVPASEELPILNVANLGIQVHPLVDENEWNALLSEMNDLDFHWIKFQMDWGALEPQRGQYSDLFYIYAQRVQWATFQAERPLKVVISVAKAPDWARPAGADLSLDGPPADPNELARFITDFINETKPQDNRIAAFEIWNEPNLEREWNGVEISGQKYMEYFRVSYNAIKAIAPNITVVTAGLAPLGGGIPGTVADREYLRQMYAAGLGDYNDVKIGIHPYGWGNPPDERCCQNPSPRAWGDNRVFFFLDTLQDYIDIIQQNGDDAKLWLTEFGWGTYKGITPGGGDLPAPPAAGQFELVSSRQQAEYTVRAIELLQSAPLNQFVEVSILWNLNFSTIPGAVDEGQEQAGYAILDVGGAPRLVYRYLQVARKQE